MSKLNAEIKATTTLAVPLILTALAQMGMEIVDTLMMGMLGPHALASGALGTATFILTIITGIGFLSSIGVFTARAYGAKNLSQATKVVQHGFVFAIAITIPGVLVLWWMPSLLLFIGEPAHVVAGTKDYLHGIVWGILPLFLFISMREFSAALTKTRIIMITTIVAIPFNVVLNYIFMYGKLGLPAMHIGGIGLATAVVEWLMFFSITSYLLLSPYMRRLNVFKFLLPSKKLFVDLFRVGWPIGIFFTFEVGMFSITSVLMGYFGETQLAAHQIALQVAAAAFMLPMGISQATAIRVGHHMGADNPRAAKLAFQVSMGLGLLMTTITAIIFVTLAKYIVDLFLDIDIAANQPVIHLAEHMLYVAAVFQWVDAVQVIANGSLRGLKDTFVPMVLGVVSYWAAGLGSGLLFAFVMHGNGLGLWWGLATGIAVSAGLLLWRLHKRLKSTLGYAAAATS